MRENLEASFEFIQRDAVQFIDEDEVTNYGLSLSLYKVLTQQPWKTQKDLQKLSKAEALELFTQFYWEPLLCDQLQSGIDYFIFDSAVVYGSALASRWLHGSLGLSRHGPRGRQ